MRIIAGTHRGRTLRPPVGRGRTRPITDRVKTSLFDILAPRLDGAAVADCFAGTGSLGIEALSRGAAFVTFAEIAGTALRLLRQNLDELGLADRSAVVRLDVLRKGLPPPPPPTGRPFNLVFLDPPYARTETEAERLWLRLVESQADGRLADGAVVVWRHAAGEVLSPPPAAAGRLAIEQVRTYGSQTLTFIRAGHGMANGKCLT